MAIHDTWPAAGTFGIDSRTCDRVLSVALARGADYADLFFSDKATTTLRYEDGRIAAADRRFALGVGIRVLAGDSTGYAYADDLTPEALQRAASTAAMIANGSAKVDPQNASQVSLPDRYPVTLRVGAVDPKGKLAIIRRAADAALSYDQRVRKVDVLYADSEHHVLLVTSDGRWLTDYRPMIRFNVSVVAEDGGNRQAGVSGGGGRLGLEYFDTHSPEGAGREAARQSIDMLYAQEAPAGEMDVVLAPGDSGVLLHEAVGHGLEADFNRKRTSNYTDMIGRPVASSLCTIVDDGTIGNSRGSINCDDEGNEGRHNVLIEHGTLVGYLHDRISAKHFNVAPSGSGRRESYRHVPMPRMTNTYMLAGESDPEDITRSVKRGVYAVHFGGGQVNISNGDFVFNVTEGYLIEEGRVTTPLKGVQLIGNGPQALSNVTMVGNDLVHSDGRWTCGKEGQSVPVGVGIPTIKISGLTVGGTRG